MITTDANIKVNVNGTVISNSKSQKLLGIKIDKKLSFDDHVDTICQKVSKKIHALARISSYMSSEKLRTVMKAFITSQFSYCPLVWMMHSRNINNRINRLHERALRIVYKDYNSPFQKLLDLDKSVTIHERNIQLLATEMFKVVNDLSPDLIQERTALQLKK